MPLSKRSTKQELLDTGEYSNEEYCDCLKQLGKVGRQLGGNKATFWAFDHLKSPPESVLDVGCGGGDFAIALAKRYPETRIVGIDCNAQAIDYARKQERPPNVEFEWREEKELADPQESFDVVTATLVCHHMNDEELVAFLKRSREVAKRRVILNDLHRHPLATLAYAMSAPFLYHNRLITHDGLLSIGRSFKRREWEKLLAAAGNPEAKITWHMPFRWIVEIET